MPNPSPPPPLEKLIWKLGSKSWTGLTIIVSSYEGFSSKNDIWWVGLVPPPPPPKLNYARPPRNNNFRFPLLRWLYLHQLIRITGSICNKYIHTIGLLIFRTSCMYNINAVHSFLKMFSSLPEHTPRFPVHHSPPLIFSKNKT